MILFRETLGEAFEELPPWARYFIEVGKQTILSREPGRRITLITMPCDSAAVGLVSLGAVAAGLALPPEVAVLDHFDELWASARQYLRKCANCKYRCQPSIAKCGCAAEAKGVFRFINDTSKYSVKSAREEPATVKVIELHDSKKKLVRKCGNGNAVRWHIDGRPPFLIPKAAHVIERAPYAALLGNTPIEPRQCCISAADVCLAVRAAGATVTRQVLDDAVLNIDGAEAAIGDLLLVHDWQEGNAISRAVLYNTRTRKLDRDVPVRCIVADGPAAFLGALAEPRFESAHVVGVLSRVMDRDQIDEVNARLVAMEQWYQKDDALPWQSLQNIPGIRVRSIYQQGA